jgi:hypothetical protein
MDNGEYPTRTPWWVIWAVFALSIVLWGAWGFGLGPLLATRFSSTDLARSGQFGDLFGGVNALFTALAFAAVWWTGRMQREELELQRGELRDTREVFQRQAFESTFFNQLELLRSVALSFKMGEAQGYAAWDSHANSCHRVLLSVANTVAAGDNAEYRRLCDHYYRDEIYVRRESYIGPYFRILYHIFKLIDTQSYLSEADKVSYANLARAQLGSSELVGIALNYLSNHSENFGPLIEKYGILKHLPPSEWRARYDATVSPTCFLGFDERRRYWKETQGA